MYTHTYTHVHTNNVIFIVQRSIVFNFEILVQNKKSTFV